MTKKVAVLALQGDFAEHVNAVKKCGLDAFEARTAAELEGADGLIIPGGESTAIARLSHDNRDPIFDTIIKKVKSGMPVYGTCMGSIFLAREIEGSTQGRLALMDIKVRRNAFGPQRNSFEMDLRIACLGEPDFPAVFIRAPLIIGVGAKVQVLASVAEGAVMARQENMLVTAFHPEIVDDSRVHRYFVGMVNGETTSTLSKIATYSNSPNVTAR